MNRDTFHILVNAYCARTGQPFTDPAADHCVLSPPPGRQAVILAWDAAQEEVVLIAQVGERPVALDDQGAMALLSDAYLGQNLGGAAAGIDPDSGALVLWRRLPACGLTADALHHAILRTLSAAQACLEA